MPLAMAWKMEIMKLKIVTGAGVGAATGALTGAATGAATGALAGALSGGGGRGDGSLGDGGLGDGGRGRCGPKSQECEKRQSVDGKFHKFHDEASFSMPCTVDCEQIL